ncbi:MAG: adenosylcobinamide-phosphate synthase CbiB [Magnetospiraceae bacterium]
MLTFGLIPHGGFDPLFLLLAALVLDAYLGEMDVIFRRLPHPVVIIGRAIDRLDRKLNRETRGDMDRRVRGLIAVIMILLPCAALGWIIAWLSQHFPFGWAVELTLIVTLIAQRSLYDHVAAVRAGLKTGGLEGGRLAVAKIVGRDPLQLDGHGVARAAIESAAENFSDGVVAPIFWYLLFGLPGLLVYKAVNTLDSMIGHRTPRHQAFGMAAARLDDILNLIPARLAGLILCCAALFVPKGNPVKALTTMLRDAGKHRSPNAGWPEGAMAGALGLALAGPRRYREAVVEDPWIGSGRARATPSDIRSALHMLAVGCLISAGLVLLAILLRF